MINKKFISFIIFFILIQPFFDVTIYLLDKVLFIELPFISLIRPFIAIGIYIFLLFNSKVSTKEKKISFAYLLIYAMYLILHLINIRNNFFELSYGNLFGEFRYLCNYGYFILQLINFYLIFKIIDEESRKKILKSFVFAVVIMCILYFMSLITNTSPRTYIYSLGKDGWKGWSVSSHYIGHCIVYALPVIMYILFEKKYIQKWYKYLIFIFAIIPPFYLVGTKTPLFAVLLIVLFYTFMRIVISIKEKSISITTIFLITVSLVLICTFPYTFGYNNFKNQLNVSDSDESKDVDLIKDNLSNLEKFNEYETMKYDKQYLNKFENRMMITLYKYREINSSVFDNRIIQKNINKYLRSISPIKDRLLGYGHDTMPNCNWVETDILSIYYCYGLIGLILVIIIPLGCISILGLRCLFNFKNMTKSKFLLGFGFGISLFVIYSVGYTMQFAQTVFYMIILLVVAVYEFIGTNVEKKVHRDYLFMINDLCVGGAEVGMIDVINELVIQGKKVDVVLLRKNGPLLTKLSKDVEVYEILNKKYSLIKRKIYHICYILGGPFIKYVYKHTIKNIYETEIAYLEGYPAVFIASSNNSNSTKIASIRVGLKKHKLSASKIPWGNLVVKKAYKKMDHIYTVSELTTKEFIEKYPFCKEKTSTIYTYFNVEDIRKKSLEKIKYVFDKKKINFLAIGRFNKQKSYNRLIEAFATIANENENVLLHFLGKYETNEGQKILDLIKEKKLEDKVILHGVVENPYAYIKECSCLISSSLYEGYPRVINEALCLGKLCIGTNVTGTREALQFGKLGILVEDSIDGLINGMKKYINNTNIISQYKNEIKKFDGNKETYFNSLETISHKKKSMVIYMPKLSYGGMEKSLVNLIYYAKLNEKYNLTLYLVYKGNMNYLNLLPKNLKIIIACKGKWNIFGKLIAIFNILLRCVYQIFKSYDIAISYSYQHPILNFLTRMSSQNNIVYIHSNIAIDTNVKELNKKLKKCGYEKFNKIICVSNDSRISLCRLINRTNKVYTINNFIDGDNIIEKSKEKIDDFEFKKGRIYFINVSRHYEKYKKLTRIIDATKRLNEDGYKFDVIFIGDGEDHKMYVDKVKASDIKNIHFLGKKSNPYKYLNKSSAFVLSSSREGYPVVFVESMILNIPIITTDVSDAKEEIDNKYGFVVLNNDTGIYDGMKKFMDEGFNIKDNFDYVQYNQKIYYETIKIYEE